MIYLDYAATSLMKPEKVCSTLYQTMLRLSANPGRGGHSLSLQAAQLVYETREKLCSLFHIDTPEQIAFFPNTTAALNTGIKGLLKQGDHVVATTMEHNSVLRPLESLKKEKGIQYTLVRGDQKGRLRPEDFQKAIIPRTRLVICTHASNVCGNVYDISAISRMVRKKDICFMVDGAQSAGLLDIDARELDLLAFPGHKALYGPQGSGGLYVRKGLTLSPLYTGGTGSLSQSLSQPEAMPDRLESGTLNVPAIVALGSAVDFIHSEGRDAIFQKEKALTKYFSDEILNIPGLTLYGDGSSVGVTALNINGLDCIHVAEQLNDKFNIAVRSGLHCAPLAHKTLGTSETGCVRFSFGYFTTKKELDAAIYALNKIAKSNV